MEKKWSGDYDKGETQKPPDDHYLAGVMEIILKSRELGNHPPLTEIQLADRTEIWANLLFKVIPHKHLLPSFTKAFADSKDGFIVNAYQMANAYRNLSFKLNEATRVKQLESTQKLTNSPNWEPCDTCFGSGFITITKTVDGRQIEGVVRSDNCCNYWTRYSHTFVRQGGK